jgi:hypothetical protein
LNKIEILQELFLNKEINGKLVDEDIFNKALKKCIGDVRFKHKASTRLMEDEEVVEQYIEIERMEKAINSAMNLQNRQPNSTVKFDDVRNMSLDLDNLEGYTDAEKNFVQQRLCELSQEFNLEKSTDKFLAYRVVLCELKIMQLETLIVMNPKLAKETQAQAQIDLFDKQYKVFCESLNALKRQRDNTKEKPKEKLDLAANINKLDKSITELQLEAEKARQEEKKMIEKINKKR